MFHCKWEGCPLALSSTKLIYYDLFLERCGDLAMEFIMVMYYIEPSSRPPPLHPLGQSEHCEIVATTRDSIFPLPFLIRSRALAPVARWIPMRCQFEVRFGFWSQCSVLVPRLKLKVCKRRVSPLVSPHLWLVSPLCYNLYVMSACSVRRSFSRFPWLSAAI